MATQNPFEVCGYHIPHFPVSKSKIDLIWHLLMKVGKKFAQSRYPWKKDIQGKVYLEREDFVAIDTLIRLLDQFRDEHLEVPWEPTYSIPVEEIRRGH